MTGIIAQRERLRALLTGQGPARRVPPVWDVLSARMAEEHGITLAMLPGSLVSLALLAAPDLTLLSATELVDQVRVIRRASSIALIVDGDHGYGNALNVARTVSLLEEAGATAVTIEDTLLPARHDGGEEAIPIDEATGKIAAAKGATAEGMLIGARINLRAVGPSEIADRARAYEAAGADFLFLARIGERAQIGTVAACTALPLVAGQLPSHIADDAFLANARVRLVLAPQQVFDATMRALDQGYADFAGKSVLGDGPPRRNARLAREDRFTQLAAQHLAKPSRKTGLD